MKIPSQCGAPTMEESSVAHQNGSSQQGSMINKQNEETSQRSQYSIPGILHFIQHEWARFELERSQWEVDRAELQARIAFLQGERKGQENLKNDLVRRIKMLEYALKQERAKFHKLKYGVELQQGDMRPPILEDSSVSSELPMEGEAPYSNVSNVTWRQGRQLLRQYLQEIGYTDMIIDVRNLRVRSLLGLNNNAEQEENHNGAPANGNESNKRASETQGRRTPAKKAQSGSLAEAMILDTEAAVMANFEFLSNVGDVDMEDDDDMSDDADIDATDDMDDMKAAAAAAKRKTKSMMMMSETIGGGGGGGGGGGCGDDDVDAEAEEVLNELNLLTEAEDTNLGDLRAQQNAAAQDWNQGMAYQAGGGPRHGGGGGGGLRLGGDDDATGNIDSALGLGELAQLTVNNDAESTYDVATSKEAFRKTWNAKYTLRSHFDGVRALAFHPIEPVLITASEDHTLKLWNLQKTVPAKKSASLDVEPLYTFRSHGGAVLCLAMSGTGEQCYSGGLDGAIHCWNLPNANIDPYDAFEPDVLSATLKGHSDAVWGLAVDNAKHQLLSCSADGTVKLWSPQSKMPLLQSFTSAQDGIPSSVDFVRDETHRCVAAYQSAACVLYDTETGAAVVRLEPSADIVNSAHGKQINRVVCHPTLALTITAHEDRHIRFWDNATGKLTHSMVAHLDAVTSLAVDPNGLYLLSGSHDCSIRLWHVDNKTCVQEITAHRKKFDESILDVAFHPTRPYIASAGADALAKVFV